MKLKRKLISCICMFAVALTSLVVGVWALKTVDFTVGGNLSYVAPGIEATISKGTLANGTFVNSADASTKMPQTQITKTDTASTLATKFSYWQNLSLAFNEAGDDTTITFSITNDMSSKYLAIDISTSFTSADNATISISASSAVLEPSASQSFTITLAVTDKTADASLYGFSVVFNMTMADSDPTVDLQYDSTNDYYYVEMGTYNSSAVRWKLVGVNGEHLGSADAPDAGKGTFILETLIDYNALHYVFDETNNSNEYATSDIRTYLNGDYITALNLANDATYNAITAREISDLYTDMAWRIDDNYQVEDLSIPSGATGADKLWLMSVAEVYTLLGGGTIGADRTISSSSSWSTEVKAGCDWDASNTSDYYWLRSPNPYSSANAFFVSNNGGLSNDTVGGTNAVRPAFNVRFKYTAPVDASEYPTLQFYVTNSTNKTVSVQANSSNKPTGELVIPSKVLSGGVEYTVTSIAYVYSGTLLSSSAPDKQITLPEMGVVPEPEPEPEPIVPGAFYLCEGLTSIIIPDSVTSIGEYAFFYCTGLTSITIPDSVTSIGYSAFSDCTALTSATIGSGVTSIGDSAFYGCTSLTSITIPDSVTSIEYKAFEGCTSLTSITIPDSITSIEYQAFYGCTGLTSITIPDSITSIGEGAFEGCTNLTYTTYSNAKYLGNNTNPYVVLMKATSTVITSCTINSNCKVIYVSAFSGCTGLTTITIPDRVKSIGDNAFYKCTGLTSVTIGSRVTSIEYQAFYCCTSLTSITIPNSVTSIGQNAFRGCTKLATVNVKATSVPTGGGGMFTNCSSSLKIYVPTASVDAYKVATYWKNYSTLIQGKSF